MENTDSIFDIWKKYLYMCHLDSTKMQCQLQTNILSLKITVVSTKYNIVVTVISKGGTLLHQWAYDLNVLSSSTTYNHDVFFNPQVDTA